jgi:GR25 family glycosyltransferase involved in LPS biosynthesis
MTTEPEPTTPNILSKYIDHVVYINLERRKDRRTHIENQLRAYGVTEFERFNAFDRPGQGIVGCGYSHLAVLKMARERKYKNVLILEDDFRFVSSYEKFKKQITQFFESSISQNYDVCMLGYNLRQCTDCPEFPFVKRVQFAQTASGYIVNARYYDHLIELYEWAIPLLEKTGQHWVYANDVVWKDLQMNDIWYCFTDRVGNQLEGFSDNAGCYMEHNC